MSPRDALKKLRSIWSPKIKVSVGSLYDVVEEEEERLRIKASTPRDILESVTPRNSTYDSHTLVVTTVSTCIFAANDFIYLVKESQTCLYKSMSTWVGRPEDPRIASQIVFLKGLTIAEALVDCREGLKYLLETSHDEKWKLISTQFACVYEDLCKLYRKMDRLAATMSKHVHEITPVMLKYSKKDFPSISAIQKKSEIQLTGKVSAITYGK